MRCTCCCSTDAFLSLPRSARSSSWSSGMLLQRKNDRREASSTSVDAGTPCAGRVFRRILFDAEQEVGRDEQRLESALNTRVEIARLRCGQAPALFIKREKRLDVCRGDRTPERAARERRQNRLGAGRFLFGRFRIAGENLRAACGRSAAGRPVRSADDQLPDVGCAAGHVESLDPRAIQPEIDRDTAPAARRRRGLPAPPPRPAGPFAFDFQIFARRRDADPMKARLHRNAHLVRDRSPGSFSPIGGPGMRTLNTYSPSTGK